MRFDELKLWQSFRIGASRQLLVKITETCAKPAANASKPMRDGQKPIIVEAHQSVTPAGQIPVDEAQQAVDDALASIDGALRAFDSDTPFVSMTQCDILYSVVDAILPERLEQMSEAELSQRLYMLDALSDAIRAKRNAVDDWREAHGEEKE